MEKSDGSKIRSFRRKRPKRILEFGKWIKIEDFTQFFEKLYSKNNEEKNKKTEKYVLRTPDEIQNTNKTPDCSMKELKKAINKLKIINLLDQIEYQEKCHSRKYASGTVKNYEQN